MGSDGRDTPAPYIGPEFTTIEGLKRRAKKLKRALGITHTAALDEVAKRAGYANYLHALKELRPKI